LATASCCSIELSIWLSPLVLLRFFCLALRPVRDPAGGVLRNKVLTVQKLPHLRLALGQICIKRPRLRLTAGARQSPTTLI
jgi:hypothetical protein